MIRSKNCGDPPSNWGPGLIHIAFPFTTPQGLPSTGSFTYQGAIWLPFDFDIIAWAGCAGAITGGTSPTVDFTLDYAKTTSGSGGFTANLTNNGVASAGVFVDNRLSAPIARNRASASESWCVARAVLNSGGSAVTGLVGLSSTLIVKPRELTGILTVG